MLHLFFRCIHCRSEASAVRSREFPLCELCASFLADAPALCQACGGTCGKVCLKSPSRDRAIESYTARYLLIEPGYAVLRTWKKAGGPAFDRKILTWDGEFVKELRARPEIASAEAIVPVPQRLSRAWRLGRSPARIVAESLAAKLRLPVRELLAIQSSALASTRQAERSFQERLSNELRFEAISAEPPPKNVILVDDFMTSGKTLRQAAAALRLLGIARVQAFCLGVRPLRRHEPERIERRYHLN